MKKFSLIIIAVMLLMLSACTAVSDINSDDEPMDSAQAAIDDSISNQPKVDTSNVMVDWVYYKTMDDLVENSDLIVIAKVVAQEKMHTMTEEETAKELGVDEEGLQLEIIPFQLQIIEVLKGSQKPDSTIIVEQQKMLYQENELLKQNETYLFFLKNKDTKSNKYTLQPPTVGYPIIKDGEILVHSGNNLLSDGMLINNVKSTINDSVRKESDQ
jgi:hypothetical protein